MRERPLHLAVVWNNLTRRIHVTMLLTKVYIVNANGTGYGTLIDLHAHGAGDLEFIPSQTTIIIPLMQDNKLVGL